MEGLLGQRARQEIVATLIKKRQFGEMVGKVEVIMKLVE